VPENFDAFGEVLPARGVKDGGASGPSSAARRRAGQIIFWLLVVAIVLARIFYFTEPVFRPSDASATKTEIAR
jgi:hypothetical protein